MFRSSALLGFACAASLVRGVPLGASATGRNASVISVFGSSVANGAFCGGNCSGHALTNATDPGGCYQSRLRQYQQAQRGRSVFNNCHDGDTTPKLLARFDQMLAPNPAFVLIGLSLANEGLMGPDPQKIFNQYAAGLQQLIVQARTQGIEPVVGLCYPNSDYTAVQYEYIKRMNLLINGFDVPSVNFLGTIDDGQGRWVAGFHANSGHPSAAGSTEMYYALVPSLWEAIAAGKKPKPERADGTQFTTLPAGAALTFTPATADTMHSFTMAFGVRCVGCNGAVAAIEASVGPAPTPPPPSKCGDWCAQHAYKPDECNCGVCGSFGGCTFSCTAGDGRVACPTNGTRGGGAAAHVHGVPRVAAAAPTRTLSIDAASGGLKYSGGLAQSAAAVNDGTWHAVVLTHFWCNGSTALYVDGTVVAQYGERLAPSSLALEGGSHDGAKLDVQDLLIYRAGINADEVSFLSMNKTTVLQASLEVYAPLSADGVTENRAQSMSTVTYHTEHEARRTRRTNQ